MTVQYKETQAQIFNHQHWIEVTDPEVLKNNYTAYLKKCGFNILQFNEHYFDKQGYTCFWLLAESHLAIHTFPENNTAYIELSSCNEDKMDLFKKLTRLR